MTDSGRRGSEYDSWAQDGEDGKPDERPHDLTQLAKDEASKVLSRAKEGKHVCA